MKNFFTNRRNQVILAATLLLCCLGFLMCGDEESVTTDAGITSVRSAANISPVFFLQKISKFLSVLRK